MATIGAWAVKIYQEQFLYESGSQDPEIVDGIQHRKGACNCAWDEKVLPLTYKSLMEFNWIGVNLVLTDSQNKTYRATTDLALTKITDIMKHQDDGITLLKLDMNNLSELQPV